MSFCSKCGTKLIEGSKFCPNCGNQVSNGPRNAYGWYKTGYNSQNNAGQYNENIELPKTNIIKAFIKFWEGYADFRGLTSVGDFWFAILASSLLSIIASIPVFSNIISNGREYYFSALLNPNLSRALACASFVPLLAMYVRRLRDSGKKWTSIFMYLIPIAGPIIILVYMCQKSADKARLAESERDWEAKEKADILHSRRSAAFGGGALITYSLCTLIPIMENMIDYPIQGRMYRAAVISLLFLAAGIVMIVNMKKRITLGAIFAAISVNYIINLFKNTTPLALWANVLCVIGFIALSLMLIYGYLEKEQAAEFWYIPFVILMAATILFIITNIINASSAEMMATCIIEYLLAAIGELCVCLWNRNISQK